MSFWTLVIVLVLEAASPANGCAHHRDQCSDIFEDCCEGWMACNEGYFPVETGTCAWGTLTEYKCCSNEDVIEDIEGAIGGLIGIIVGASVGGGIACCACCALAYCLSNKNKKKRQEQERLRAQANSSAPPQPAVQMGAVNSQPYPSLTRHPLTLALSLNVTLTVLAAIRRTRNMHYYACIHMLACHVPCACHVPVRTCTGGDSGGPHAGAAATDGDGGPHVHGANQRRRPSNRQV